MKDSPAIPTVLIRGDDQLTKALYLVKNQSIDTERREQ